jgi:hypothetical protein
MKLVELSGTSERKKLMSLEQRGISEICIEA